MRSQLQLCCLPELILYSERGHNESIIGNRNESRVVDGDAAQFSYGIRVPVLWPIMGEIATRAEL